MNIVPGARKSFGGVVLEAISLEKIQIPTQSVLLPTRLKMLQNGHDPLIMILQNPFWRGDPITLSKSSGLRFTVLDGRHRIYLANQMDDIKCVWARVQ